MYPSCLIGALMAIVIATTFGSSADFAEAFLRPLTYQYFLYHTMLVVLGLYIPLSREVELRPRHYLSTMAIVVAAGFVSFYLNSAFAVPVYSAGELLSVEYTTNFLYTFAPPVGLHPPDGALALVCLRPGAGRAGRAAGGAALYPRFPPGEKFRARGETFYHFRASYIV